jgi:phosphoglycolate phosphatase
MKVLSAHTNEKDKQVIKAVIFDKDGVLLDLEATWLNSAIAMTHFVSELTDGRHKPKAFQAIIGIDEATRQIDANGLFAAGSSADQFLEFVRFEPALEPLLLHDAAIRRQIRSIFLETRNATLEAVGSVPNGDVKTPLKSLYKAGYQLAILTNDSEDSARQSCDDIGILPYFKMIVGFDSGFGSKPGPEGLIAICEKFNITPNEAAMVGDTYADFGAAKAAGAGLFIGISNIYPDCPDALKAAEHLLPDLSGLPSLLAKRAA